MGNRYKAILKSLGEEYFPIDVGYNQDLVAKQPIKGVIIASPTETHSYYVKRYGNLGPVLCEKPICKSMAELEDLLWYVKQNNVKFTMMMQYSILTFSGDTGASFYRYYNSGKDGLGWDCIQILGLARGHVELSLDSPVWACQLNGRQLSKDDMDASYVQFVSEWLAGTINQSHDQLMDMHFKAAQWKKS